jgi:hypothetical protein
MEPPEIRTRIAGAPASVPESADAVDAGDPRRQPGMNDVSSRTQPAPRQPADTLQATRDRVVL